MEYNQPSEIVKDINFGNDAKNRVINREVSNIDNSNYIKPGKLAKNMMSGGTKSSAKRTQVGKKV